MDGRLRAYLWLIDILRQKRMTLAEIKQRWSASSYNVDHGELTDRTFHRYRENIATELGVYIECNKKAGNVYYIKESIYDNAHVVDWLLSSFRISEMVQRVRQHDKIMLENPPQDTLYMHQLLDCIDENRYVRVSYKNAYGVESTFILAPLFVRLFRQRWYLIGRDKKNGVVRILAVNRLLEFEKLDMKVRKEKPLTPDEFFADCFGIMKDSRKKAEHIRLRAFWPQYVFLEETPLHHSQRMVKDSGDGEYREYELYVQATFDFKQELLKNSRALIVLEPQSLKNEMIAILKDMLKGYETGEDYSGEGKGYDADE